MKENTKHETLDVIKQVASAVGHLFQQIYRHLEELGYISNNTWDLNIHSCHSLCSRVHIHQTNVIIENVDGTALTQLE